MSHPTTTPLSYRMFDIDGTNLVEKPILIQGQYITEEDFNILKDFYNVETDAYNPTNYDVDVYSHIEGDFMNYANIIDQNNGTYFVDFVDDTMIPFVS